jgi:hypothetical protein
MTKIIPTELVQKYYGTISRLIFLNRLRKNIVVFERQIIIKNRKTGSGNISLSRIRSIRQVEQGPLKSFFNTCSKPLCYEKEKEGKGRQVRRNHF